MPFRGERSAPIFDHNQPSMLRRYFVQLDRLFVRCAIASSIEKKEYATSFLKGDIAECWEALPEFADPTKTYAQFTYRLVLDLYNQITDRYTVHNLESLISDRIQSSIRSLEELSEFHLRFNAISKFLLEQDLLSSREQSQLYLRAFDAMCQSQIDFRLQIKYPHRSPSLPHTIDAIFEAAQWILRIPTTQSSSAMPPMHSPIISITERTLFDPIAIQTTPERPLAPPASNSGYIKSDELTATLLRSISATIIDSLSTQTFQEPSIARSEPLTSPVAPKSTFSTQRTYPDVSASLPAASPSFSSASTSFSIDLTACTTPKLQDKVQTRIDAIEDELRVLRAQSNDLTDPTRSTTRSDAISTPSTHLYDSTTDPTTQNALIRSTMRSRVIPSPSTQLWHTTTTQTDLTRSAMRHDAISSPWMRSSDSTTDPTTQTAQIRSTKPFDVISNPSTQFYDSTTDLTDLTRSAMRHDAISSPSMRSSDSTTDPTTQTAPIRSTKPLDVISSISTQLYDSRTDPTDLTRSAMRHHVVSSLSTRLCYNMADPTAPTNISDQIHVSSIIDRVSSTADPRTFAHRCRPVQATPRRFRSRCTHAQSIPATQTAIESPLSIREPLTTSRLQILTSPPSDASIAASRTLNSLVPVVPVAQSPSHTPLLPQTHSLTLATVETSNSSPLTAPIVATARQPHRTSSAFAAIASSTSQVPQLALAPLVEPSSFAIATPVAPIVAPCPIVTLETSPIVSLVLSSPIEPSPKITPALAVPAVTSYILVALAHVLAHLSLRPPLYIRNHARLKYMHLNIVPQ